MPNRLSPRSDVSGSYGVDVAGFDRYKEWMQVVTVCSIRGFFLALHYGVEQRLPTDHCRPGNPMSHSSY